MNAFCRLAVGIVGGLLVTGPVGAQDPAAGAQATKPQMMAKVADPDWEVVAVRATDPKGIYGGYQVEGRDVQIRRKTVESMLLYGYTAHKSQLVNAPDWIRTELWDARGYADTPGQPNHEQMQSPVRKLLAQRFGLVMHTDQKEMEVYALTVAKGGPKLTPSAGDPNGRANENDREDRGQMMMHAGNISMSELAGLLMRLSLDRPSVDRTGLKERYDFILTWTADERRITARMRLQACLQRFRSNFGLKPEAVKAQADVLVIDGVERPRAN